MEEVTVSPKYQIVIPKKVRESLKIRPGQKLNMVAEERSIVLLPQRSMKELQEYFSSVPFPGEFERDPDREFD